MTSIIIPCFNQLEFTRHCLTAIFRHTRPPWELIVVDNGSTDGTGMYLAGIQDAAPAPVTVITNGQNLGFPAAINQGLKAARGDYLVLLNNDAVVTDGWLDQLIALANAENGFHKEEQEGQEGKDKEPKEKEEGRSIGLVGPMSNYASPPQLVQNVPYRDMEEMQGFARRWRDEHRGQWFTVGKLSGFCLLMKRAVYETIGGLDERFGLGLCDDDDLAERARRAGFELAVAHDLFVHHFGGRTFQGSGIDVERLLSENSRKFAEKWGTAIGNGRAAPLKPWVGQPRMGARQDLPRMNSRVAEAAERLGFGLRPCQGFPVRGSVSACHANRVTSALFKPGMQIFRTRLARILSVQGMHSESTMSRLQEPQAEALQMGVKRLACRGAVGTLAPTAQVTGRTKLQKTIQVTEALPRIAVTEIAAPAFGPAVDVVDHLADGDETPFGPGQLSNPVVGSGHCLGRGKDVEIAMSASEEVAVVSQRKTQKVQALTRLLQLHNARLLAVNSELEPPLQEPLDPVDQLAGLIGARTTKSSAYRTSLAVAQVPGPSELENFFSNQCK